MWSLVPPWWCAQPQTLQKCGNRSLPCAGGDEGIGRRHVRRCPRAWWNVEWRIPRIWGQRVSHHHQRPGPHLWFGLWRICQTGNMFAWEGIGSVILGRMKFKAMNSQTEHRLHGDEQRRHVEGLEENLSCPFTVFTGVQRCFGQQYRMLWETLKIWLSENYSARECCYCSFKL